MVWYKSLEGVSKLLFIVAGLVMLFIPGKSEIGMTLLASTGFLALVGAIVGEFVGSDSGLGYLILRANVRMNTTMVFAIILTLALMGAGVYYIMAAIERFAMPWRPSAEEAGKTVTGGMV